MATPRSRDAAPSPPSTKRPRTLTSIFALFEDAGNEALLDRAILQRIGKATFEVFQSIGALVPTSPISWWTCGDATYDGCTRRIVPNLLTKVSTQPFVAVCGRDEPRCENLLLSDSDRARHIPSRDALERLLARLFTVEGVPSKGPYPLRHLGEEPNQDGPSRDVFLAWNPGDPALAGVLSLRERASRPTLILIPTTTRLPPDLALRHAPTDRVALLALTDSLRIESGSLVRVAVGAHASQVAASATPIATLDTNKTPIKQEATSPIPRPRIWQELRLRLVDGHTLSIRVGDKHVRATYLDLGMGSGVTRAPSVMWELLVKICEEGGQYKWTPHGDFSVVKRRMAYLREALRSAFGVDDDPFEKFSRRDGWRAKFVARGE